MEMPLFLDEYDPAKPNDLDELKERVASGRDAYDRERKRQREDDEIDERRARGAWRRHLGPQGPPGHPDPRVHVLGPCHGRPLSPYPTPHPTPHPTHPSSSFISYRSGQVPTPAFALVDFLDRARRHDDGRGRVCRKGAARTAIQRGRRSACRYDRGGGVPRARPPQCNAGGGIARSSSAFSSRLCQPWRAPHG